MTGDREPLSRSLKPVTGAGTALFLSDGRTANPPGYEGLRPGPFPSLLCVRDRHPHGGNRNGFRERRSAASRARPKATPYVQEKVQKRGLQVGDDPAAPARRAPPPGLTRFGLKRRLQGIYFCGRRAMRPWLLIVAFAFSIGAAIAEDLPPAVQKAIAENKRGCKTVAIEKGFLTRKDINGDGRPDFVLDYESFTCDGDRRWFCGSIGCLTQVFASLPNGAYAKVFDDNVRRIDFREVQGRPAIVVGFPASRAERTRRMFATSSNPGTARPSWICLPRQPVERPE